MVTAPGPARRRLAIITLAGVLLVAMVLAVGLGAVNVTPGDTVAAISRGIRGAELTQADAVIWQLRAPRVLLAALVGATLALAGVLYQALFKNALADPYILGVSSGAGLGATIAFVAAGTSFASRAFGVPLGAFLGALLTIAFVVRLASRAGRADTTSLLLAGVAISYTLSAVTSFLMVVFRNSMQSVVFWMMGGLTSASWQSVWVVSGMFVIGSIVPILYARELDIMLLGDERAGQLGVNVERFKLLVLGSASLVVAAAVSVSGLIGFVGLMTPHMARLVLGPDHRLLLPASTLAGAIVMVFADLAARTVLAPVEIPVGIVTAVLGGPFFVWLLVRKERP